MKTSKEIAEVAGREIAYNLGLRLLLDNEHYDTTYGPMTAVGLYAMMKTLVDSAENQMPQNDPA